MDRRELLRLAGLGGVVVASAAFPGIFGCSGAGTPGARSTTDGAPGGAGEPPPAGGGAPDDFFFLQLSDTHWGFAEPAVNPQPTAELPAVIDAVNAASVQPDFVVFTGDLTHSTDDVNVRKLRMAEFKEQAARLRVPMVKFMPGEHDAAADLGATYREFFGDLHYSFDHKGIHFIAIDNVSNPTATIGDAQLAWIENDLADLKPDAPLVVLAHRPLWDLKPEWDWTTTDGGKVLELLAPHRNVVVFFGHIHQEIHHETGHIPHHSARSLMFALPPPETAGKKSKVPWDPQKPNAALGYRKVTAAGAPQDYPLEELPVPGAETARAASASAASVVSVAAKKWAYSPSTIRVKKGVPVILEVTSRDVHHGFNLPDFHVRTDAVPGRVARVEFTPDRAGKFAFHCDFFCGEGHDDMQGELIVE